MCSYIADTPQSFNVLQQFVNIKSADVWNWGSGKTLLTPVIPTTTTIS